MAVFVVGSFPIGGINLAAAGAVTIIGPLLGTFDSLIAFGLGPLSADLLAQFNAALQAQIQISFNLTNPLAAIQATINALAHIQASLQAAINLSIPTPNILAQLSAAVSISGSFGIKLGGIQLLISAALAVKLPAVDFLAALAANLSVGPVVVASWGFHDPATTLAQTGTDIGNLFHAGLGGLLPFDIVYGVLLVSKASASAGIAATMRVV